MFTLAACDAGPSAVQGRARAVDGPAQLAAAPSDTAAPERSFNRSDTDRRRSGGRTAAIWSANRDHSAEENAEYHFRKDGAAFGAKDVASFVAIAHAFIASPPKGAETLNRPNGDTLIYDPAQNIFAVANRDGVPKTLFKPDNGAAYWEQQKTRSSETSARYAARDGRSGDGRGAQN